MTKIIILCAVLALAPAAFADTPNSAGIEHSGPSTVDIHRNPGQANPATDGEAAKATLGAQSEVTAIQIASLLEKITSVTGHKDGSMATLFAIQAELTRQTGVFKTAYAAALDGKQDVNALFDQVIDGKSAPDASHLKSVSDTYEALLTQFGQLVNSRFLASNAGGIPTYHGEQHAADANTIADAARTRAVAYEANVDRAASDLKGLLALH